MPSTATRPLPEAGLASTAARFPAAPAPDAPGGVPLLGHLPALLRRPLSFFESTLTDEPLVRVGLGPVDLYLANDPALVHRLQMDTDCFERGRFFEVLASTFGTPQIAADGEPHRRQRRTLTPPFGHAAVRDSAGHIAGAADRCFAAWRPGEPVAADRALWDLVASVMLRHLFSTELPDEVVRDFRRTFDMIARRLLARTVFPEALTELPTPGNRRFRRAMGRFCSTVDALIRDRRFEGGPDDDVLGVLLSTPHPVTGRPHTDREIRGEILTVLFAGLETTSTSLAWAVCETAVRPKLQRRLHEEAERVGAGGELDLARLRELRLTRRVVDETLRLHAPLLFTRRARRDVFLAGVRVPAGSEVGYSPRALHRDPATYAAPHRFDPDRGESRTGQDLPRGAYFPWGSGPHRCIGEQLAVTTMVVALAALVSRWHLRLAPGTRIRETPSSLPQPSSLPLLVTARA